MYRYVNGSEESAFVGIWWFNESGEFKCLKKLKPEADETYNHVEYRPFKFSESSPCGSVRYDMRTHSFEITCTHALIRDVDFKLMVVKEFNLTHCRFDFVVA